MKKLLLKLSLMQKVVILTVISGLIGWIVLDQVQTSRVNKILDEELSKKLSKQSALERMRFDKHIKDFSRGLKIIASHENFYRYINRKDVFFNKEVITHKSPPKWLPRLSIIRSLIQPRTILMYNNKGVLKEIFQSRNEYTPGSIVNNPQRLLSLGHEQSYITMIERTPYIITSEKVHNNRNNHVATLMLLSPVDDEFMIASQGISGSSIVALLSDDSSTILTSNNYVELPPGTPLDKINDKFISVGESFFDYGSSSFPIRFISFRSSKEVDELTKSVMVSVRREGIIVSFTFIACFMFVMVLFTRRVEGLGEKVAKFSRDTLNVKDIKSYKGDQLFVLEKRFSDLIDEVIESRNRTRNDAAEKILLVRKNIEEKEKQLDMLQIATEKFGVGIILKINNEYTPANEQMKKIVLECGDVKQFIPAAGVSSEEIYFCNDDDGNERVFDTRMLEYTSGESEIYLVQEITEIKNKTKELEHLALHDSLTALPNRTLLQERLIQALSVAQREYKMVALFMMDLDRFKEVNDTLGHHYGDLLLKEVAKRLRYTLRDSDTVARFGGDEFSVLLTVNNEEVALKVAKKIIAAIDREFVLEGHSISTEISIGIAMFPEHGEDPNILLKRADVAMYVAKSTRTGFTFYDPRQDPHSLNRLSLMADLRHAIENDELVAYYQPKIDIKTGKVSSAEALIRWHHPVEGAVSPDLFVPIAE
ncbi:MAG: bifunctional diguanylate cyclase/phosphodiesterase, partial [Nitrosopumilus sp.]|nr:bifunctional diguanylate cyclase/phosphodiesterase [Nitrosopumilus sp.]